MGRTNDLTREIKQRNERRRAAIATLEADNDQRSSLIQIYKQEIADDEEMLAKLAKKEASRRSTKRKTTGATEEKPPTEQKPPTDPVPVADPEYKCRDCGELFPAPVHQVKRRKGIESCPICGSLQIEPLPAREADQGKQHE